MSDDWVEVDAQGKAGGKAGKKGKKAVGKVLTAPPPPSKVPTIYEKAEEVENRKQKRAETAKKEEEERQAKLAVEDEQRAKKAAMKAVQQQQGQKQPQKKKAASPNDASESSVKAGIAKLDGDLVNSAFQDAKSRFPDKPMEWLRILADTVISQLKGAPTVTQSDGYDAPACYLNDSQRNAITNAFLAKDVASSLPAFFASCVKNFVSCYQEKNRDHLAGIQVLIQLMVDVEVKDKKKNIILPSLQRVIELYKNNLTAEHPPNEVLLPILWSYSLIARKNPTLYLFIFKMLMIPMLRPNTTAEAKSYMLAGLDIVVKHAEANPTFPAEFKARVTHREFLTLLEATFAHDLKLTEDQKKVLKRGYLLLRECVLRFQESRALCFPAAIRLLASPNINENASAQIRQFAVMCLARDANCQRHLEEIFPKTEEQVRVESKEKTDGPAPAAFKPEVAKNALSVLEQVLDALTKHQQDAYSPFLVPQAGENLKPVLSNLRNAALQFAEQKGFHEASTRIANKAGALLKFKPALADSPSVWPLWLAFAVSAIILVLLGSHLACRHYQSSFSYAAPTCQRLEKSGILSGVDRFYTYLEPLSPYVIKVEKAARPYFEKVGVALKPALDATGQLLAKASPYLTKAREAAKPATDAIVTAFDKATPYLNRALEAAAPYVQAVVSYGNQLLVASTPYAQTAYQTAVEALTSARNAVVTLVQKYTK